MKQKRIVSWILVIVMLVGTALNVSSPITVNAAEEAELYTYTISFTHQRTNTSGTADTLPLKLNRIDSAGNKTEVSATFEVVPGSNNAIRRAVIQSASPSLTLELERNGSTSGTDSSVGVFSDGRFVVSAEYPDVYLSRITGAAYYMTWDGEDTVTATIVKDNDSEMTVYYGGKSATGGTAVPLTSKLLPNGGGNATSLYQVSLDITDEIFEAGYDMGFKVRSSVNYNGSTSVNSIFASGSADQNVSTGNLALFTLRRYEIPPTLYTYTIDLFKADGTLLTDTPVLKDLERDEPIDATVVDGTNFKRLTFTSEYDNVTVQMSGTGFGSTMWGAYDGDGDKRVVLTSEYNHVYLQEDVRATYYVTGTEEGKLRFTIIRNGFGDSETTWFIYNLQSGAANTPGSVRLEGYNEIEVPELVPYNSEEIPPAQDGGSFHKGVRTTSYLESAVTIDPEATVWFNTRCSTVYGTGNGSMMTFTNSTSNNSNEVVKYAEFTMPVKDASSNTLTMRVEEDDNDPVIEIIGKYDGNDKIDLSVNEIPGYRFIGWSAEGGGSFSDSKSLATQYTMPFAEATVTALFKKLYTIVLEDATSSTIEAVQGERPTIMADNKRAEGQRFKEWEATDITLTANQKITNPLSFTMPASNITLKAIYEVISGETYSVTVTEATATVGGSAVNSGGVAAGEKVTATAEDKSSEEKRFKEWTATGITLTETQKTSSMITFAMPAGAVALTAVYERIPEYYSYRVDIFNFDPDNRPVLYDMTDGGDGTLIDDVTYSTSNLSSNGFISLSFASTSNNLTVLAKNSMENSGPFGDGSFVLSADYPRAYLVGGNDNPTNQFKGSLNPATVIYVTPTNDNKITVTSIKEPAGAISIAYWAASVNADKLVDGSTEPTPLSVIPELIPNGTDGAKVNALKVFTVTSENAFTASDGVWFFVRGDFGSGLETLFSSSPDNTDISGNTKNATYSLPGASTPADEVIGYPGEGQYTYTIDLFGTTGDIPSLWDMERDEPISARATTTWPNGNRRVVMEFNSDYDNVTAELYGDGFDDTIWGAYDRQVALTPAYSNAYLESGVPATCYMTGTNNGNLRVTTIRDNDSDIQFFYSTSTGSINKTVPYGGTVLDEQALIPYDWTGDERKITYHDSEEIIPTGAVVWFKVRCQVTTGTTRTIFGTGSGDSSASTAKNVSFVMPEFGKVIVRSSTESKYLDDGVTDPSGNNTISWTLPGADDSAWKTGAGSFGFKIPSLPSAWGVVTELNGTIADTSNRVPTYFFRYDFELTAEDVTSIMSAYYRIGYKDAVIIYLNGQRIGRHNVPADGYGSNLEYGSAISMSSYAERGKHLSVEGLLREGTNTIAVELHQRSASGSDIYLNFMDFVLLESEYIPLPPDITGLNMQTGINESQRNFTWQSSSEDAGILTLWKDGDEQNKKTFNAAIFAAGVTLREDYLSNKTTVTGLEPGTKYYYKVSNGDPAKEYAESATYSFTTDSSTEAFSFLFAADPQIRGSGGLETDKVAWQKSLDLALAAWPNISLIVGGGDQVSDADSINQWDAFLSPVQLKTLPYAPSVGNHDLENYGDDGTVSGLAKYPTYITHFNPPNLSDSPTYEYGGGHYWYSYGDALFVHVNSAPVQQHQGDYPRDWDEAAAFIEQSIEDYTTQHGEKPAWKIVVMHHAVYATYRSGSAETTELRNSLADAISDLDIDLVMNGHEHNYSRTYMMKGKDTPITSSSNYIGNPKSSGARYIKSEGSGETLYVTVSSATTRTNAIDTSLSYVAFGKQDTPMISKVDVTKSALTISVYSTGEGVTEITEANLVDSFTLSRPSTSVTVPTAKTGLVYNGKVQTGVAGGTGYTVVNDTATNAGTYTAIVKLAEGYEWASGDKTADRKVTFTIAKKEITVTADNKSKKYGAKDPALTWKASGLITGDKLTGSLKYTGKNVGKYDIVQNIKFSNSNYQITFTKGTMTINALGKTSALKTSNVPANKSVYKGKTITLKAPTGTVLYYTTNGKEPTTSTKTKVKAGSSTKITISKKTTVRVIAVKTGYTQSNEVKRTYRVMTPALKTSNVPASSSVIEGNTITLKAPTGTVLYYTTNGKKPTTSTKTKVKAGNSTKIRITKKTTVRVIAVKTGCTQSKEVKRTYSVKK